MHKRVPHATFLMPAGESYSVVILDGLFLSETFGEGWELRRFYYGYSGGFVNGMEVRTKPEPLAMLSVHPPVLIIAGNRWNNALPVLIYDVGTGEQIVEHDRAVPQIDTE
jgi:hypothetical protein